MQTKSDNNTFYNSSSIIEIEIERPTTRKIKNVRLELS